MTTPVSNIPIPTILQISEGSIFLLEETLMKHGFSKVFILFDEFSYSTIREKLLGQFQSVVVESNLMQPNLDINELVALSYSIKPYDSIIAIGGGAVIDYGKYTAFLKRSPFISIPTSASNDGFASSNCSLLVNGKKTTVPARVPYGIIADLNVIQKVPTQFLLAGIGDLVSNITALYDWEFEENNGVGTVNAFAHMLSKKAVNSFIRTPMTDIRSCIFLKELISSLTMGGISTVISGNSSPISGSEHLISHAIDKISTSPQMHGIQVGIATYIMANVQAHRAERIQKIFTRTGFFDYVQTIPLNKEEYIQAIKMAPQIKPNRFTYLHVEEYRQKALQFIEEDPIMYTLFKK
ncbi:MULTISPECIES: iron-containing alcohol dehydrogenase family protein [unclassified Bacillus (in: firmicutes)]|uniref:iron-containing alcohol dehydrogenase family protein n=1 Tax=unclassified Bacillus (in: firmicutes) TaxID=185979 RepID=UPI0008DF8F0C|nr:MULTISPECIES: iron-containing alcohol dehydrogenase family protein [unclassified Bacillus (in: firmicutes)]SFA90844.1 glycerol-1-phosphate dehydrogenase [NAD(P)+] [Bacillus sp. UNCCL13]SFQ85406.1 glycerol-1-phosphate dehydrogenase [NAD(P)+] [Bacillus sp. cl95]